VLDTQAVAFLKLFHFRASHSRKTNFLKIDTNAVAATFEIENVSCQMISKDMKNLRRGAKSSDFSVASGDDILLSSSSSEQTSLRPSYKIYKQSVIMIPTTVTVYC